MGLYPDLDFDLIFPFNFWSTGFREITKSKTWIESSPLLSIAENLGVGQGGERVAFSKSFSKDIQRNDSQLEVIGLLAAGIATEFQSAAMGHGILQLQRCMPGCHAFSPSSPGSRL